MMGKRLHACQAHQINKMAAPAYMTVIISVYPEVHHSVKHTLISQKKGFASLGVQSKRNEGQIRFIELSSGQLGCTTLVEAWT